MLCSSVCFTSDLTQFEAYDKKLAGEEFGQAM